MVSIKRSTTIKWLISISFLVSMSSAYAGKNEEQSVAAYEKALTAYNSKMYAFSVESFEKALEYDRSNYEAMLYLAKVHYKLKDYPKAIKVASSLTSSFYPSNDLKIEAFRLMADIQKKQGKNWHALAYLHAASEISTSIDISHLVADQMKALNLDTLPYPEFDAVNRNVITSKNMKYVDGGFVDVSTEGRFAPVSFSVKQLKTKFVVVAGFDNRLRFNKVLVIKIRDRVDPVLLDVSIQKRKRGGAMGTKDLYLKVMDWNFDSYPDLVIRVAGKRNDVKQSFLLYNPKSGNFSINEDLSALENPILDRTNKSVLEEGCDKRKGCTRKRYRLFNKKYALTQFDKNICEKTCMYTSAEIDVSSLRSTEYMYLVSTIETEFEELKTRFKASVTEDSAKKKHTLVTKRTLKAYYSPNYEVARNDQPIMVLDLDGSWEFPASYVKSWVNNYFSRQPLDGQLSRQVLTNKKTVITN